MIRIGFFAPLLVTGGTQRHLQQVLRLLDPARFATRVYTLRPGGDVEGELRADGVDVRSLSVGGRLTTPRAVRALLRTARELRADGIHVVHGYQWRPALVGTIAGRLAGVPLVIGGKRSLTGDETAARFAWRLVARGVDTIVANAEAIRTEAEAHGVRARWAIVPSGVDVERFDGGPSPREAKAALGLEPGRPVVGTVGRLEARKGHAHLLRAAQTMFRLANGLRPQVLIVGDGPLREELARRAAELGVAGSVRFAGRLADVRVALSAMDVFVLPSTEEGMPNALLEAMASRRPVVATAVGGMREVVDGERTGVLVPPEDPEALGRAVVHLLADPARARRLGDAARVRVAREFSARAMVARLECLYEERLVARGGSAS
jgi:glycosyltransferase involved in cell wall biosynthesis